MSSDQLLRPHTEKLTKPHPVDTRVGVAGAGRVGTTLAQALHRMNMLAWVATRSAAKRLELHTEFEELVVFDGVENITTIPDIILICTSDTALENVSDLLARNFETELQGKYVIHCSGSKNRDVLGSCKLAGANVIAAHPFQTFAYANERLLYGIAWGVECDTKDEQFISSFIRSLGGSPVILNEQTREQKSLYHITAVIASNYIEAVIASSLDAANEAQIQSNIFLPPIIRTAVESALMNLAHNGSPPLTGPIARGDVTTIRQHLQSLEAIPSLLRQYCYMGLATTEFACNAGYLSDGVYEELKELLQSYI